MFGVLGVVLGCFLGVVLFGDVFYVPFALLKRS